MLTYLKSNFHKLFFIILMFSISALFGCKKTQDNSIKTVNVSTFAKHIEGKNVQLVDARMPQEFEAGHIKNAKLINVLSPNFKTQIKTLDTTKPLYLYCRSGKRSLKAAEIASKMGFKEIYDLDGGFNAWQKEH